MAARRRRSVRRGQTPGWLFMLGGLALGLLVAAGVYLSGAGAGGGARPEAARATRGGADASSRASTAAGAGSASASDRSSGAASAETASSTEKASARPASRRTKATTDTKKTGSRETQFDFYEILPQYEVVVPEVETVTPAPSARGAAAGSGATTASATPPAPVEAPGEYILQTGSFRSHGEADRMQASLALLGIESRIQKVTIDDDEFHRVRVGPIDDLETLNRIRNQLRDAGINALVMRLND